MSTSKIVRVSISEAAKLFGVNAQTIRRAIKSKAISYVVVQGRYKINFESLLEWSKKSTTISNKMTTDGIGQYVDKWKITNAVYEPSPEILKTGAPLQPGTNMNLFTVRPEDRTEVKQHPSNAAEQKHKSSASTQNETLPL